MCLAWCQEVLCASSQVPYEADDKTEAQRDLVKAQCHATSECGTKTQTLILFEQCGLCSTALFCAARWKTSTLVKFQNCYRSRHFQKAKSFPLIFHINLDLGVCIAPLSQRHPLVET